MTDFYRQKILVSPLAWGLGHASRLIPLIQSLLKNENTVLVYAPKHLLTWITHQVPNVIPIEEKAKEYNYGQSFSLLNALTIPCWLVLQYMNERKKIKQLVATYRPDVIISDHRYGFFHNQCKSYFVTHQVIPALPWWTLPWKSLIEKILQSIYRSYTAIWILDYEIEPGLAGKLSHPRFLTKIPHQYLGPQSRFTPSPPTAKELQITWILSGPTKHRKMLLKKIMRAFAHVQVPIHIFGYFNDVQTPSHMHVYDSLSPLLEDSIKKSKWIVAHSGYSSLMDAEILQETLWLFPTRGQYEQIYLLKLHQHKHHCFRSFDKLIHALKNDISKTLNLSN